MGNEKGKLSVWGSDTCKTYPRPEVNEEARCSWLGDWGCFADHAQSPNPPIPPPPPPSKKRAPTGRKTSHSRAIPKKRSNRMSRHSFKAREKRKASPRAEERLVSSFPAGLEAPIYSHGRTWRSGLFPRAILHFSQGSLKDGHFATI